MRNIFLFLILCIAHFAAQSQITLSPEKPSLNETVTLTFNAGAGSAGLMGYDGDIYLHTGILTSKSNSEGDWKNVLAEWGENKSELKLSNVGENLYELKFSVASLYGLTSMDNLVALTFVFRNEDGSKTGKADGGKDMYWYFQEPSFKKQTAMFEWTEDEKEALKTTREFVSIKQTKTGIRIQTTDGDVMINPLSEHSIQVEFLPKNHINPPSYSLAIPSPNMNTFTSETPEMIIWGADDLVLNIQKSPFTITYTYKNKPLLSEETGFYDNGSWKGFRFKLGEGEMITGGGSRAGGINRRGKRFPLYNKASYGYEESADQMYYSMPVVLSNRKYMLVFDNGAKGYMDIGADEKDVLEFGAVGGRMSYYIVADDDWEGLAENFTELTGRQPMPPRWAFGNIASRMGYHSQKEVESVVDQYMEDEIPLDGIVLDLFWFGKDVKGHLGNLDWHTDSFPQPQKMMDELKEKGVNTVLITEPFIVEGTNTFQECVDKSLLGLNDKGEPYMFDFYFGHTGLLDVFKEETRDWFWNDIYKKHTLTGVAGWWGDLGEPEVHPDDLLHVNGRADEVHNLYGHEWAKLLYDGFAKDFPNRRPVTLMRSGFVGSQRYGMIPWTGDVNRSWGGLRPQVELGLTMGLQGLAWTHSDLGGFAGNYQDSELYLRWLEYGVFQPMYRTHAQEGVPAEPIFWDDSTKAIARDWIKFRYRLMPYNYTLAWENSTKGIPMMRPIWYYEDSDALFGNKDEYLWGDAFLVAPVVNKGALTKKVYLPRGHVWFDAWDDTRYEGGSEAVVSLNIEKIPIFARAGAFFPMVPDFQSTKDYSSATLNLHYYHDATVASSKGQMYEDDGETKGAFDKKQYELLSFESAYIDQALEITIKSKGYNYPGKPESREITLHIHNIDEVPAFIRVDGKKLPSDSISLDNKRSTLKIVLSNVKAPTTVKMRF